MIRLLLEIVEKGPSKFEIHNFFANAFESTLPFPKVHNLNLGWLLPGLPAVAAAIYWEFCRLSSQNLLPFLNNRHWSSEGKSSAHIPEMYYTSDGQNFSSRCAYFLKAERE